MIGIIGYGMVGKAVANGFDRTDTVISDPAYNSTSVSDVCAKNPPLRQQNNKMIMKCGQKMMEQILKEILSDVIEGLARFGCGLAGIPYESE